MSNPAPAGALRTLLGMKEPGQAGRIVVWDTAEVTVGRAPENDVVLEDSDASREHVLFLRTAQGHQVKDLGTSNGTQLNGEPFGDLHLLNNKDVVKIGEVQITFIQTRKDPSTLGLAVDYASSLKGFTTPVAGVDPGATTLGLATPEAGGFEVAAVGGFEAGVETPTRDLDLEFNDFVPGESLSSGEGGCLSLHLEIEGLSPDLARLLEGLLGKTVELPAMKVRIKSE